MQATCPFCCSPATESFVGTVLGKHNATYSACAACGSLHVASPHWLDEAYANPGEADRLDGGSAWRNEILAGVTYAIGRLAPPGAWLDFGCGQGLLIAKLRERGHVVNGYDRYRGSTKPTSLADLYTLVTSYEVLEHQVNPREFIIDVRDRLTENGILILSTCLREPDHGQGWGYLAPAGGQHVAFASVRGMQALAEHSGLNWWATGVCRENGELQIHVLSRQPMRDSIICILDVSGFAPVQRLF